MAAITHRARGAAGRARARRALRPPTGPRHPDRATPTDRGGVMSRAAVYGTGSWGPPSRRSSPTPGPPVTMWGPAPRGRRAGQRGRQPRVPPELRLPGTVPRDDRPGRGRRRRGRRRPRGALADAARQTSPPGATCCRRRRGRLAHEGRRARHDAADVRGRRRGRGRRPRPGRRRLRAEPRARDRAKQPPRPSSRAGARRWPSAWAAACAAPYFRPYTAPTSSAPRSPAPSKNVIALAVGMAEAWDGRQQQGLDHHPRPRRDDAPSGPRSAARP